jgi:hypothetical protein
MEGTEVVGSSERGNETSGFIKGGEFLDYLERPLAFQEDLCSMSFHQMIIGMINSNRKHYALLCYLVVL